MRKQLRRMISRYMLRITHYRVVLCAFSYEWKTFWILNDFLS